MEKPEEEGYCHGQEFTSRAIYEIGLRWFTCVQCGYVFTCYAEIRHPLLPTYHLKPEEEPEEEDNEHLETPHL